MKAEDDAKRVKPVLISTKSELVANSSTRENVKEEENAHTDIQVAHVTNGNNQANVQEEKDADSCIHPNCHKILF